MYLHELTREQQDFAANHHSLVYAFLREKKLRRDDYYDVVIFGYLQAVQKYLLRADLRQRYKFSTIAWRAMNRNLGGYCKSQSRPSRKAMTVSLETMVYDGEKLTMAEVIPGPDLLTEKLDAELLWEEISAVLTDEQAETLRMKADGYTVREIASARKSPLREIEDMLAAAAETARGLCLA
jgi:RNA polymerase sigma-70 factor (ECF subfamily)